MSYVNLIQNLRTYGPYTPDWSTGLIYKGGKYYDPRSDLWLTFGSPAVVWAVNRLGGKPDKRCNKKQDKRFFWLLFLLLVLFVLVGCTPNTPTPPRPSTATPEITVCPTPSATSTPIATPTLLPPPLTATSIPTVTPVPTLAINGQAGDHFLNSFFISRETRLTAIDAGLKELYSLSDQQVISMKQDMRLLISEGAKHSITVDQLAYLFATAHKESEFGLSMTEKSPDTVRYATADGLCNKGQLDIAEKYIGRGFAQITGRCQYAYVNELYKRGYLNAAQEINLIDNPEKATEKPLSAQISTYIMVNGTINCIYPVDETSDNLQFYNFPCQGLSLKNYEISGAGQFNWDGARDIINSNDSYRGDYASIARDYYSPILREACTNQVLPPSISCE